MRAVLIASLAALTLQGCAPAHVKLGDGTELPADVYAHQLSVQAYTASANDSKACYDRATSDIGLAVCALSSRAGGQTAPVPTYQRGPTGWDRVLGTVQTLTPLGMGFLQYKQADQANERAYLSGIRLAEISAARETAVAGSLTTLGSNGYTALQHTAAAGQQATADLAAAGFGAIERLGTAAVGSAAGSSTTWAETVANLPPTTAITAGGSIAIAGRDLDQSITGGHRVSGDQNEVDTSTDCTSTATAAAAQAGATGQPSASGTTGGQAASTNPNAVASTGAPIATTTCRPRG